MIVRNWLLAAVCGLSIGGALPAVAQQRNAGGQTRTTVFGVEGQGSSFVYVFDRSGSMGESKGRPLRAAKAELLKSLDVLGQTQQFQIIFYNERPRMFAPFNQPGRLAFGNDSMKEQARGFVNAISAQGGTHHEDALLTALRLGPDVIFFLTDGTDPAMTDEQLAHIADTNGGLSAIHVIEFGIGAPGSAGSFLTRLARENRGKYVYIDVTKLE